MKHAYPHFLIVGFMKSATTTLFDYILEHPNVQPPLKKELHYFTRELDPTYDPALYGLEYHEQLQHDPRSGKLCGEASPSYIVAADRIAAFNPDVRIIALLRDPVERALSQYRQYVGYGFLKEEQIGEDLDSMDFVRASLYERYLTSFFENFPGSNLMLISFEEFCARPAEAMKHVFRFLGLVPLVTVGGKQLSPSPAVAEPRDLRRRLEQFFVDQRGKIPALISKFGPTTFPASAEAFDRY